MIRLLSKSPALFRTIIPCLAASFTAAFSAVLNSPPQAAVNAAISQTAWKPIGYATWYNGGAYTNGAWDGGASITLAVASYAGNTTADAALLSQIRYTLTAGHEICANGGYPAQHELHVTGMFTIARQTPRIWNQLTAAEITKINLMMKAALVASAFTTSNNNPYILARTQQYTLDGDDNLHRDWGPNYREGMLGGILVGMVYFGGPVPAKAILDNYNHTQFVAELYANGLPNTHGIFNWKAANPGSPAPTGTMIQNAVKDYKYYLSGLDDWSGIYTSLVNDTYGMRVNAGLNNGAGINGAGKIYSGAETLPNPGALGMLKEFDTIDGVGYRSSLIYSYDGYRPHQTNQLVLITGGYWQKGSAPANAAIARIKIGNTDLFYKIQKGYIGYAKGASQGMLGDAFSDERGLPYVWPLWQDVLLPYHDSLADSDGDGTDDATEIRLGLDPASGSSRFALRMAGNSLQWPGAAGLTFTIQRSVSRTGIVWETITTIPGGAGINSYTDPSPPAGGALYRVGLNP